MAIGSHLRFAAEVATKTRWAGTHRVFVLQAVVFTLANQSHVCDHSGVATPPEHDHDEPDDDVPPSAPSSGSPSRDVDDAMRFLLWARAQGFAVPVLRVGAVEMTVNDQRPRFRRQAPGAGAPASNIWAEHGDVDSPERERERE